MNSALQDSAWPMFVAAPALALVWARFAYCAALRRLGKRVPFDQETQDRGQSLLIGQSMRQAFVWSVAPIVNALVSARVGPNALTLVCMILSLAAGTLIACGAVTLGGVIGLCAVCFDYFDGRVARLTGRATRAGAFLDSTLDRYGEVAFLSGAAVLFRDSLWALAACLVALGAGGIVSYTRAKAEALGICLESGLMQRPERVMLFCFGASFGPALDGLVPVSLRGQSPVFAAMICVLAVLTLHNAVMRTVNGYRSLRRADTERNSGQ